VKAGGDKGITLTEKGGQIPASEGPMANLARARLESLMGTLIKKEITTPIKKVPNSSRSMNKGSRHVEATLRRI